MNPTLLLVLALLPTARPSLPALLPEAVAVVAQAPADDALAAFLRAKSALQAERAAVLKRINEAYERLHAIDAALGNVGPQPKPPDPPTPDPPPLSDAAAKVRDLVAANVPAYAGRQATAGRLAQAYRAAAAAIGDSDTPAQIIAATGTRVQAALGADLERWRPFFGEAGLRGYLNGLATAGTLATPADHRRVWAEVAAGLEAVGPDVAQRGR